jgi:hypothetical protein
VVHTQTLLCNQSFGSFSKQEGQDELYPSDYVIAFGLDLFQFELRIDSYWDPQL